MAEGDILLGQGHGLGEDIDGVETLGVGGGVKWRGEDIGGLRTLDR